MSRIGKLPISVPAGVEIKETLRVISLPLKDQKVHCHNMWMVISLILSRMDILPSKDQQNKKDTKQCMVFIDRCWLIW